MDSNSSSTSEDSSSATQNIAPDKISSGTASSKSEPISDALSTKDGIQTAPDQDSFTHVDSKSLPPELKAKYDSMLSDYKKKTSELAQERREIETLRQKATTFDQISGDPAFVDYWNGLTKAQQAKAKEEAGISDQEFNQAFESKENFSKFIQKVTQGVSAENQQEITNLKADLMIKDFKQRNPDFDELNEDRVIEIQLRADPRSRTDDPKQWQKALDEAIGNARIFRDKWIDKGRKEGLSRVNDKVNQSTNPPTASPEQLYPGGNPANLSVSEAIELARRGIKVPRK